MSPLLHALRASLIASIALSAGCIGGDDDKVDSETDSSVTAARCENPTAILDSRGVESGFQRCADGTINRAQAVPTVGDIDDARCAGTEDYADCSSDADCTSGAYGACVTGTLEPGSETFCGCVYSCETDADCGEGRVCLTHGVVDTWTSYSVCIPAECTTNADCASEECALTAFNDGCGPDARLTCREADDACRLDDECVSENGGECAPTYDGESWACRTEECAIGRPLLVEGEARRAPPVARGDWGTFSAPTLPEDPALRAQLGAWWQEVAALEHASVASFARFTLQLMALGAPPELLAETQAAAADEVRHAQLAYGLASAYLGAPVGPGALALGDLAVETDRAAALRALITEACVGETLGVAEAQAAAARCEDPAVRAALSGIAEDEARHAALAWRALRWMLAEAPELREVAELALREAIAGLVGAVEAESGAPAYGFLGAQERLAVRRAAAGEVVLPCFEAARSRWLQVA
ncbi:MAG: ferritin-like domain-containing protein [Alphaproteobacteria bacterium]|nr:ferritin-like domain-containing protein [Alphaproteobacteria bacterium]MCB9795944.1 ferritin-like domain-containing protein [Alphaproteobacteria bacterium]